MYRSARGLYSYRQPYTAVQPNRKEAYMPTTKTVTSSQVTGVRTQEDGAVYMTMQVTYSDASVDEVTFVVDAKRKVS